MGSAVLPGCAGDESCSRASSTSDEAAVCGRRAVAGASRSGIWLSARPRPWAFGSRASVGLTRDRAGWALQLSQAIDRGETAIGADPFLEHPGSAHGSAHARRRGAKEAARPAVAREARANSPRDFALKAGVASRIRDRNRWFQILRGPTSEFRRFFRLPSKICRACAAMCPCPTSSNHRRQRQPTRIVWSR
jgi:hypothetical protein